MSFSRLATLLSIFAVSFSNLSGYNHSSLFAERTSQEESSTNDHSVLVTPRWLAQKIEENTDLRIIDLPLRKTNYSQGHIPGAVYLDWRSDIISSDRSHLYRLPSKTEMEKLLSGIGVTPDTTVVLTDNMGNRSAVRMYYTLKYFGHDKVRILDGGTDIWKKSKQKLVTDVPKIKPTKYDIKKTREEFVVALETVENAIEQENRRLIDGRPGDQYTGEKPGKAFHTNKEHARRGHVPTAVSIPWTENLNEDGTFKSLSDLRELYASHGIDTDDEVITYCNEGLHAAMPWFILRELLGSSSVQVYDDSMVEWANRDDTPMTNPSARGK